MDNFSDIGVNSPERDLFQVMAPEPPFLDLLPSGQCAFLSSERRWYYATILYFLFLRRQAHEVEKYHNDIYDAVQVRLEEEGPYSQQAFRADMEQLLIWGNVERRIEPKRLQHIADRRVQKFLYRLSDHTRAFLESLSLLKSVESLNAVSLDQDHLLDLQELVEKIGLCLGTGDRLSESELRRLGRNIAELDNRCRLISNEISDFGAKIATFNIEPFQLETLPDIIDRLARYVDQYLQRVANLTPPVYSALSRWNSQQGLAVLRRAREAMKAHAENNPLAGALAEQDDPAEQMLARLIPFFAPEGIFQLLCVRVNEQVRILISRIRQYLDDIRHRNIRIRVLRRRVHECITAPDSAFPEIRSFIRELMSTGQLVNDAGNGTPDDRVPPPRPNYWRRRATRPAFVNSAIIAKTGSAEASRELEKAKARRLRDFMRLKAYAHGQRGPVHFFSLKDMDDIRNYMDSVKFYKIGRKHGIHLGYSLKQPDKNAPQAEFKNIKWYFSSPDYIVDFQENIK
ncbi:DUF2397 family protein [bacterium]|nr:DUF2397 family protein [bacterium]